MSDAPLSADAAWAEAKALVRQYRRRALAIADDRIADLAGDIPGQARWRLIRSWIVHLVGAAAHNEQHHR